MILELDLLDLFQRLGLALAVGLLIGFERGWHDRDATEGTRVAGIRTFGIIGLYGSLSAILASLAGQFVLVIALPTLAIILTALRFRAASDTHEFGATTIVAALLTFSLGALAAYGYLAPSAAIAVVVTVLLGTKVSLHRWLQRIEEKELHAVLKLLLISVVVLPVLPNRGFGPWEAINPFELWLMVVLIAAISFAGYAAVKIFGEYRGIIFSALTGGLVSSTAVTVSFARMARENSKLTEVFATGIVLASAVAFPRTFLVAGIVNSDMWLRLAAPMGLGTIAAALIGFLMQRHMTTKNGESKLELANPLDLSTALKFGVLLTLMILAAHAINRWLGDAMLYPFAFVAGLTDVDAINLTLSRMSRKDLALDLAANAIVIAIFANLAFKGAIAFLSGGRDVAKKTLLSFAIMAVAAGAGLAANLVILP